MGKSAAGTSLLRASVAIAIALLAMGVLIGPKAALLVLAVQGAVQLVFARVAMRQIGGQSGDVLGAMQQLAEIAGWLTLAR
jgi:adenosylcobinamide-GDP ribazoletransferase